MRLHWSPRSPFVRQVMIAAHELGFADRIVRVRSVAALARPNPEIMADNPLSKIPTLVLEDGRVLADSRVIVSYLDSLGEGRLGTAKDEERWDVLGRQSLADGLLDLLILWRAERDKPEARRTPEWLSAFATKAEATLDHLESGAAGLPAERFDAGQIALGCALSYLDFRFGERDWRARRPALAAWHAAFAERPSARATEPVDD